MPFQTSSRNPSGHRQLSVLLVDDEPHICLIYGELLRMRGHLVVAAEDGREALEKFERYGCDVVLTDLDLPDMDGEELAREIKKRSPEMRIVMATGLAPESPDYSVIDAVLQKPFSSEDLMEVIERGAAFDAHAAHTSDSAYSHAA